MSYRKSLHDDSLVLQAARNNGFRKSKNDSKKMKNDLHVNILNGKLVLNDIFKTMVHRRRFVLQEPGVYQSELR